MPVLSLQITGIVLILLTSLTAYLLTLVRNVRNARKLTKHLPGYISLFRVDSPGSRVFPERTSFGLNQFTFWLDKYRMYESSGWDVHSVISLWPKVHVDLVLSDAAAVKEIVSARTKFVKPIAQYDGLNYYGHNIISSEGDEWKRFRKITAPAFSDRNNKLVWDETVNIMLDLFNNVWKNEAEVTLDNCLDLTLPIALQVIGTAGFGRSIPWENQSAYSSGHQMSFKDALQVISADIVLRLAIPNWVPGVTARLRRVGLAFDEMGLYMHEMIEARKTSEKKEERYDLFSSLLDANEEEDDLLSESELMGNIFIFVLAGHETTAHTLCYTFALLALYEDEQEVLYQHVKSVYPSDRLPTYGDIPRFTQSTAVLYETLRMFPPASAIPKDSTTDTSIVVSKDNGEAMTLPVLEGMGILIHAAGIHYNPRYWKDPDEFRPGRFLQDWPRDAFLSFSAGSRSCLGRKFSETEGIAVITILILRYKITVKKEPQFAEESFDERKSRLLASMMGISLTPVRVPLTFTRRTEA